MPCDTLTYCDNLQIENFLSKEVAVMQWVALAAFVIQILSVMLACWLSAVQRAEVEAAERYLDDCAYCVKQ